MAKEDDERSVEELIAAAEETCGSLSVELAQMRKHAEESGVRVTVELNGRLVDLDLDQQAMTLPPDELSAVIRRLTGAAAAEALAEGITTLAGIGDALLGTALTDPGRPREPVDDTYTPQTWRMS